MSQSERASLSEAWARDHSVTCSCFSRGSCIKVKTFETSEGMRGLSRSAKTKVVLEQTLLMAGEQQLSRALEHARKKWMHDLEPVVAERIACFMRMVGAKQIRTELSATRHALAWRSSALQPYRF